MTGWSVSVGQPGMDVVLVVTSVQRLHKTIATQLAAAGYTAFVAIPAAAHQLRGHTQFDVVVWHAATDDEVEAARAFAPHALTTTADPIDAALANLMLVRRSS